jgi:hypothetical protein
VGGRKYFKGLNENHFYRAKKNGTKEKRMLSFFFFFSETSKCVYCYVCRLFPDASKGNQSFVNDFSNWTCISRLLSEHESSKTHVNTVFTFIRSNLPKELIHN